MQSVENGRSLVNRSEVWRLGVTWDGEYSPEDAIREKRRRRTAVNKNEGRAGRGRAKVRREIRVPYLKPVWRGGGREYPDGEPDKRANERGRRWITEVGGPSTSKAGDPLVGRS